MVRRTRALMVAALLGGCLAAPAAGQAAVKFTRIGSIPGTGGEVFGFVRTADGTLHIVRPTSDNGAQDLTADAISPSGAIGPSVTALSTDWGVSVPGLVALPNGSLEAFFGAGEPGTSDTSAWGITSSDGGKTWAAPVDVRSGPLEEQAYGAQVVGEMNGTTPVLILTVSGTVVVQQGLGANTPTYEVTDSTDGFASDSDAAVNAGTGQVVAQLGLVTERHRRRLRADGGAERRGTEKVPGQGRDYAVLAGRDKGPGAFGAYTTDDKHVRPMRYGGGTVAVGSLASVSAAAMAVATGIDGRIWVMWGTDGRLAVTRSNKAVTRFEPIQHIMANIFTLYHRSGDGRLGPLDPFANELANTDPLLPIGVYHARVLPELSAAVKVQGIKNGKKVVTSHAMTVTVTDAGDAVSGSTVSVRGHTKKPTPRASRRSSSPAPGPGRSRSLSPRRPTRS